MSSKRGQSRPSSRACRGRLCSQGRSRGSRSLVMARTLANTSASRLLPMRRRACFRVSSHTALGSSFAPSTLSFTRAVSRRKSPLSAEVLSSATQARTSAKLSCPFQARLSAVQAPFFAPQKFCLAYLGIVLCPLIHLTKKLEQGEQGAILCPQRSAL